MCRARRITTHRAESGAEYARTYGTYNTVRTRTRTREPHDAVGGASDGAQRLEQRDELGGEDVDPDDAHAEGGEEEDGDVDGEDADARLRRLLGWDHRL